MAVTPITNLSLGSFLQIVFSDGVRNQISEDYRDWEFINRVRKGPGVEREHRFMFQTALGAAGVQYAVPGQSGRAFPAAQDITVEEYTALMNEINSTVEIEYNMWDRARKCPAKYAEPLAIKIKSSAIAAKRRLAADFYGDGTGVLGKVATAASQISFVAGKAVVELDNLDASVGGVGHFEYGDKIAFYSTAGVIHGLEDDSDVVADYLLVIDKNRANNTVTLAGYDSAADTLLELTNLGGDTGTVVADGDVLMRMGQPSKNHSSIVDYNTISEVFAGIESLAANDGRVVHGITMSGAAGGSSFNCETAAIDVSHIQAALSEVKVRVGPGVYSFPAMVMAPESNNALVESREVDRRFTTVADNKRGVNKFVYVHESDNLEVITSEFCPKKRIWVMPQEKSGANVFEFHGSDFESVRPGGAGSEFFLKPAATGGGHQAVISTYMQAYICMICKHPASVLKIHNFSA